MELTTFLFTPGNHARRVEKALSIGADAVILDLEDAVANSEKASTRKTVVDALSASRSCKGYIRVNSMSTEWCFEDLRAVVRPGVDGIVLPKVESSAELKTVDWIIAQLEREHDLPVGSIDLMPIIETGVGFCALREIAESGTRVRRLAFGAGDFTLDMDLKWSRDELELLFYRSEFVAASRAAGLEKPIDTVWIQIKDDEGFARSAERARALGFQGKLCIYPDQVAATKAAFHPSDAEIAEAQAIVDAFDKSLAEHNASIQVNGRFIDYPIVYKAQSVLVRAGILDKDSRAS